ncbi:uncharacterized protein VTP21DRAFT_7500 [Calcarisporiella thermophila]|uniref:uncharacterized protein n=1 Tax=Calcarisporiella thermophila TaxID=911321 RepID=UPI003742DB8B
MVEYQSTRAGRLTRKGYLAVVSMLALSALSRVEARAIPVLQPRQAPQPAVCDSPQCQELAASYKSFMDPAVNPCEDFYAFTCGGFIKTATPMLTEKVPLIQPGDNSTDKFIEDLVTGKFNPSNPVNGWPGVTIDKADEDLLGKLRGLYSACMSDSRKTTSIRPLIPAFQLLAGGPLENSPELLGTLFGKAFADYRISGFFNLNPTVDLTTGNVMLGVAIPRFRLDLSLPGAENTLLKSLETAFKGLIPLVPSLTQVDPSAIAKEVVELAKKIMTISDSLPRRPREVDVFHPMTLGELSSLAPTVNWENFLKAYLPPSEPLPSKINVLFPEQMRAVSSVVASTSPAAIRFYMIWRTMQLYVEDVMPQTISQSYCVDFADQALPQITGRYYVLYNSNNATRTEVFSAISLIQQNFLERLSQMTWLDEGTRKNAADKLSKMQETAVVSEHDPETLSAQNIAQFYANFNVTNEHLTNVINLMKFHNHLYLTMLNKPIDPLSWKLVPSLHELNAFYTPNSNSIAVLAATMKHPLYDPVYPEYIKFGAPYTIFGHEIIHGYDNTGRLYDGAGHYNNWWSNEAVAAYNDKAKCFVDQYNEYTIGTVENQVFKVNGTQTLGENIADNGGLARSYGAWLKRFQSGQADNRLLPGLEKYTPQQMFFIAYGYMNCEAYLPKAGVLRYFPNEHSPSQWRVRGAVRNSAEFAQAFSCPAPQNRCEIW